MSDIKEGIIFQEFNSKSLGLYLLERDAPSPDEKEIAEDIPYMQGVHDFSMILGERIFKNRQIKYVFKRYNAHYENRKVLENKIKDQIMSYGESALIDTHDPTYYWYGKAKSVDVDDVHEKNQLKVTITFDCYPFLLKNHDYFTDIWDEFHFDNDVSCFSKYQIKGSRTLTIINNGSTAVNPSIYVTADMKVTIKDETFELKEGMNNSVFMQISRGLNQIKVVGTGELTILFRVERMA